MTIQDIAPDLAQGLGYGTVTGALVSGVLPGGPAQRAGIVAGDIVMSVDGQPVRNSTSLRNLVGLTPVGSTINLQVWRNGAETEVPVKVEQSVQTRWRQH